MNFQYEYIEKVEDVRKHIQECEGKTCPRCKKVFYRREGQLNWHWNVQRWCSSNCRSNGLHKGYRTREKNNRWKGGRFITSGGYMRVLVENGKYENEHRLVMEKYINRKLLSSEVIHHKNGDKLDNRIDNLELLSPHDHKLRHGLSETTKKKIGLSLKGRVFSIEHRLNLSKALMGNKNGAIYI